MMKTIAIILCVCVLSVSAFSTYSDEFKGKVVFVSGGSSGIGKATALGFARRGAHVALVARDAHPDWYTGSEVEKMINNDSLVISAGGSAAFFKGDISKRDNIQDVVNQIVQKFGDIDIAINAAGIGGPMGNMDAIGEYLLGLHDPIMNNLYGTLFAMEAQIGYFIKANKTGVIVNFSSYNGLRACAGCALYSASKHGIIGLTQSAALEYLQATDKTPQIRVNAIAPGLIDTPLTRNQAKTYFEGIQTWIGPLVTRDSDLWKKYKPICEEGLPSHRLGDPSEMAAIAMFLASEEASYISGTTISGDFGATAV